MGKLRVRNFSISLDGYGAGPNQSLENPLGVGGRSLHGWFVPTQTFQRMIGKEGGTTGVDDDFAAGGSVNVGASILGRNMFGPVRGPWPDDTWKGWWGNNPPYHVPVFVLTHYARPSITLEGGTVFHCVTAGIQAALQRAPESTFARRSSMSFTWRFRPCSSALESTCSLELTRPSSAIAAPNKLPPRMLHTSF
jgi:dihydrofolate reductase